MSGDRSYSEMSILEVRNLPGAKDLPTRVAGKFAMALKNESMGNHEKAAELLDEAVEAEQK